jgi:hypothetical protein
MLQPRCKPRPHPFLARPRPCSRPRPPASGWARACARDIAGLAARARALGQRLRWHRHEGLEEGVARLRESARLLKN